MADKDIEILIKTKADLTDAKAATDSLGKLGGEATAAGGKAKIFDGHMGELRKTVRELSREFPLAGLALRAAISPIGAVLTASVAIFSKAKEALDEWNKKLDESAIKLADPTFRDGIEARRNALEEGAVAAAKFADKMAHLHDVEAEIQKSIARHTELQHEFNKAQNEVAESQFGLAGASLENQFKRGLIAAETYYHRLAELEIRHRADQLAREKQQDAQDIAAAEQAVGLARTGRTRTGEVVGPAQAASAAARAKAEEDKATLAALDARQAELDAKVKEAEKGGHLLFNPATGKNELAPPDAARLKSAQDEADQNRGSANKFRAGLGADESAAAIAEQRVARAESRFEEASQKAEELGIALGDLQAKLGIKEGGAAAANQGKDLESLIGEKAGGDFEQAARIQRLIDTHQKVSAQEKAFYDQFLTTVTAHGQNIFDAIKAMRSFVNNVSNIATEVNILKNEMRILQTRIQGNQNIQ